jgi:hypothetical protein
VHVSNSMVEGPTLKLTVAQLVMEFLFFVDTGSPLLSSTNLYPGTHQSSQRRSAIFI